MMGLGMIAMAAIWLYSTWWFFADGQTALGVISLVIPPADLVLPFLINPLLGVIGLGSLVMAFAGSAIHSD